MSLFLSDGAYSLFLAAVFCREHCGAVVEQQTGIPLTGRRPSVTPQHSDYINISCRKKPERLPLGVPRGGHTWVSFSRNCQSGVGPQTVGTPPVPDEGYLVPTLNGELLSRCIFGYSSRHCDRRGCLRGPREMVLGETEL